MQSDSALTSIRILLGPVGAVLLVAAIITAAFYPVTRKQYTRIRQLLEERKNKRSSS
jgi:Na+/melibiose symporter-like transporter